MFKNNIFCFGNVDHKHLRRNFTAVVSRKTCDCLLYTSDPPVLLLGADDYNKVRELLKLEPITLGENEYAFTYNEPDAKDLLSEYAGKQKEPLEIGGKELTLKEGGIYETTLYNSNIFGDIGTCLLYTSLLTADMKRFPTQRYRTGGAIKMLRTEA